MKKSSPSLFSDTRRVNTLVFGFIAVLACCVSLLMGILLFPSLGIPAGIIPPVQPPTLTATLPPVPTLTLLPTSSATLPAGFAPTFDCLPPNPPQSGKVMEIVDGDTIRVMIDGKLYPVRYIGMDAPETAFGQEQYGDEAAQKNADLALGKDVVLIKDVSETDEFDRLLRYVFAGDVFVNYELLIQGYATVATYPPDVACSGLFREAQAYARDNLLGMWAPEAAVTLRGPVYIDKPLQILVVNKKAEYLDLVNVSNTLVDLTGWYIISERGNQRCDLSGTIPAGGKLRVYTMDPQGPGITCGFSNPMWSNDDPDAAILYDLYDREIDRYE